MFYAIHARMGSFRQNYAALNQLSKINTRENRAHQALGGLDKVMQDPDGVWDCDNYANAKYMAQDWPQGISGTRMDVDLPDGQKHRVLVARVGRDDYVLDNLTDQMLLKQEREHQGWKFSPMAPVKVDESESSIQVPQDQPES